MHPTTIRWPDSTSAISLPLTDRVSRHTLGLFAVFVAFALLASACRIADPALEASLGDETGTLVESDASVTPTPDGEPAPTAGPEASTPPFDPATAFPDAIAGENLDAASRSLDPTGLGFSGPSTSSHWHAAYAIRVCNDVLDPLPENPGGIHTHGNGIIHIHPRFAETAWENATLGVFAAAAGVELSDDQLVIPGVGEWTNGDPCNGIPSVLTVQRWASPEATQPWLTHTAGLADLRLFHDGELFTISFTPEGSLPVKPPTSKDLASVSSALTVPLPDPFVKLPDAPDRRSVSLWVVDEIAEAPCAADQVIESAIESAVTGSLLCFSRTDTILARSDIVGAQARVVNRQPGVVLELSQPGLQRMNAALRQNPDGLLRLAVEMNDTVVITVAFSSELTERTFAFTGGMTVDDAERLAALLGAA